jgi:SAM-dependent methyltransferase
MRNPVGQVKDIKPCGIKKQSDLALEWDRLAEERHRQIVSGEDLSFDHLLVPTMFQLLKGVDTTLVLDIGSGTGDFTRQLARIATRVIGIEPSHVSVSVANAGDSELRNVQYIEASLEEASGLLHGESVTAAVASMTLMTTPDLRGFAESLSALLRGGSKFVATFTHPWFWPKYWGYESEAWFSYPKETFIEAPFVISKCRTEVRTTHVHRPLEQYVSVFADAGFCIERLVEPMPSPEVQRLYPQSWEYPRFIGVRWAKAV